MVCITKISGLNNNYGGKEIICNKNVGTKSINGLKNFSDKDRFYT